MNVHEQLAPGQSLAAVIPAAGHSRRMGQPKLLLPLGGRPVLARLLEALAAAGFGPRIVVVRAADTALQQVARECGATVVCPAVDPPDMRASVEYALEALEQAGPPLVDDGWALIPADHPVLDREALRQIAGFWPRTTADVLLPVYQSQRGHPTVFRWSLVPEIRALPPDCGLNVLLRRDEVRIEELPVDSPGILTDLDTPDDYHRLQQELE